MNSKHRLDRSSGTHFLQKGFMAIMAVALLAVSVVSNAQVTTGAVRGVIADESGNALANATVTARNEDTGLTRSVQTDGAGEYTLRNLQVGSNYSVAVASAGFGSQRTEGLTLVLGQTTEVNFDLTASDSIEEIVTIGTQTIASQVAVGPSAVFGIAELESAPSINRNIADVLRADARIYVDESRGDINAIQCAGKNPRYNSLTVDGVRMNDSFGLNSNGYPTERMPFSYDAINQVAVELAPFDVEYGGFSACNINAVTKSGGNEFFGGMFYDYTSDSLRGDKLEGDKIQSQGYSKSRYGVNFGGPIIKDKLSFFAAYEKLEGNNLFDRGSQGSGAVNEVLVSQAELDEIEEIARTIYFYEAAGTPSVIDNDDEKFLIKLDWNISDRNRAAFTYQYNDGFNNTRSDSAQNEFEFAKHLYSRGTEMTSYSATLYSDWTDNFSTEIRYSFIDLDNTHQSLGGTDFGEIRVELADVDVYLGGDDSRQSNKLLYEVATFNFKGYLDLDGGHTLTFGIEQEALDIFNLFVQHTETELRFNSIADFRNGIADDIYYNNAPSHNPNDAAAVWGYDINTIFLQDEFDVGDRLTFVAGLRYDWYSTSKKPEENPDFVADYGFSNNNTVDGESLLQPRVGFTFDLSGDTVIRGGIGVYSGGNPNVWLSNTYSANNVLQFGAYAGDYDLFAPGVTFEDVEADAPAGAGAGWGVPTVVHDMVTTGMGSNFEINYLDPNFDLPSEMKFALGVSHMFSNDLQLSADLLYSETKDAPMIQHGDLDQIGTNPDGYPIYDIVREDSFVLTNSSQTATASNISVGLAKSHENGITWRVGYAWSDAEEVQPMTSSVAFSNYQNRAFFDPQEDVLATSNYNIEHRISFSGTWRKDIGERSLLTLSLYGSNNSGRPYSSTYNGTIVPYGFTPYLDFRDNVLMPGDKRNEHTGSSWTKLDMRASFDFPGFGEEHIVRAFMVVDNLTNLLDDDWGVLKQHNFPRTVVPGTAESRIGEASRYEIRIGVEYDF